MPLFRKIDYKTFERDPFAQRKPGEYATPGEAPADVEFFYRDVRGNPSEPRAGDVPTGFEVVDREDKDGVVSLTLQHTGSEYCVLVSYRVTDGVEGVHTARAVAPEVAYRFALDGDEKRRARGTVVYNERHPRPQA